VSNLNICPICGAPKSREYMSGSATDVLSGTMATSVVSFWCGNEWTKKDGYTDTCQAVLTSTIATLRAEVAALKSQLAQQSEDAAAISEEDATYFWDRVNKGTKHECWLWKGAISKRGYGQLCVNGVMKLAHKIAYVLELGAVPIGMLVTHSCEETACCNPDHLLLKTKHNIMAVFSRDTGLLPAKAATE